MWIINVFERRLQLPAAGGRGIKEHAIVKQSLPSELIQRASHLRLRAYILNIVYCWWQ